MLARSNSSLGLPASPHEIGNLPRHLQPLAVEKQFVSGILKPVKLLALRRRSLEKGLDGRDLNHPVIAALQNQQGTADPVRFLEEPFCEFHQAARGRQWIKGIGLYLFLAGGISNIRLTLQLDDPRKYQESAEEGRQPGSRPGGNAGMDLEERGDGDDASDGMPAGQVQPEESAEGKPHDENILMLLLEVEIGRLDRGDPVGPADPFEVSHAAPMAGEQDGADGDIFGFKSLSQFTENLGRAPVSMNKQAGFLPGLPLKRFLAMDHPPFVSRQPSLVGSSPGGHMGRVKEITGVEEEDKGKERDENPEHLGISWDQECELICKKSSYNRNSGFSFSYRRRPYPVMPCIYVDNLATTRIAEEVLEEMSPVLREAYAAPSSIHFLGSQARQKIQEARERTARFLGADPSEMIFTSGGTESNHLAILGLLESQPAKRHLVTSRVEHLSIKSLCEHLLKQGYEVAEVGVDADGNLNLEELAHAIRPDTALVSLTAANHETGVVWPLEELGRVVKDRGALFHVDAAAAAAWLTLDPRSASIDALSLSGHKLHAPKGVGALYLRRGVRFSPLFYGGRQERGKRPGTENVAGIVGFGKAVELLAERRGRDAAAVTRLRDRFENGLIGRVPECVCNGGQACRLANTSNLSFAYTEGEAILLSLSKEGICASSGSACTTGLVEPSYVLRAMGKPDSLAHGAVRFSFSRYNGEEEVDYLLETIPPLIEQLRTLSPFWQKQKLKAARGPDTRRT